MQYPRYLKIVLISATPVLLFFACSVIYAGRILPRVHVGSVALGGMTREQAFEKLQSAQETFKSKNLTVDIEGDNEIISLDRINFAIDEDSTLVAYQQGRQGSLVRRIVAWVRAPFIPINVHAKVSFDEQALDDEVATLAEIINHPRKDVRFDIHGTQINILYDTQPGRIIDYTALTTRIVTALQELDSHPIAVHLVDDIPHADPVLVPEAIKEAHQMLQQPLSLAYDTQVFSIPADKISSWIISGYTDNQLVPLLNIKAISAYVTGIASSINTTPQKPVIKIENEKVVEFVPPRSGQVVQEDATIQLIVQMLNQRRAQTKPVVASRIEIPVKIVVPESDESQSYQGIVELLGKATTPFTRSPANRISNIKNGIRFLTGSLIKPGEEFSTLKTLGAIDNTTGYLPELVIKGDRTVPEFGGGLCQVSTTLFRAVLNAGLPVTERRNHSYRVSYYEKDGRGDYIGPGLDATIYEPDPDFRFRNDTKNTILVYGYVVGDKATFELYGTRDGRTAEIKGPFTLSETAPGDPIYIETDTLPVGVTKQVETAHSGGSAIATYNVTYPDGHIATQEFRSYYRRWPAQFLVGTGTVATAN